MSLACTGTGVAGNRNIVLGPAHLISTTPTTRIRETAASGDPDFEVARLQAAVAQAAAELQAVRKQIPPDAGTEVAEFIDAHLLMTQDQALIQGSVEVIRTRGCSAEWALRHRREALVRIFAQMDDPYLRTRVDDLAHVVRRIMGALLGESTEISPELGGRILVTHDLTPADVVLLQRRGAAGFVTEYGGLMSHTTILARSLGIPAVVGARGATLCLQHGEPLVLDAANGVVLADCEPAARIHFEARIERELGHQVALREQRDLPAVSRDQIPFQLLANVELAADVEVALAQGAMGVGLYRTEFLFMNRQQPPSEEEHYAAYAEVVAGMQGRPVTIRTLDLGADKPDAGLIAEANDAPPAYNPALGLRAIRLCLKEPELFRPQLRAILRAAAEGPVRLMLPMLTNLWEAQQAKRLIGEVIDELRAAGAPHDPNLPVGGMIEVPAAALTARAFCRELDFLSIGTNDLIQYTLAIDRVDDELSHLYDPLHPAVLRLLVEVLAAGRDSDTPIAMCGEMAGDPRLIPLLAGLGLREFSMQPGALLEARRVIRDLDVGQLERRCKQARRRLDEQGDSQAFIELCQTLH